MADEATISTEGSGEKAVSRQFTVAAGTAITKGTVMVISGDRTAIAHNGTIGGYYPAGVAVEDKTATDNRVTMGCMRTGVCGFIADGTITTGDLVEVGGSANRVKTMTTATISSGSSRNILGRALETVATAERCNIVLLLG